MIKKFFTGIQSKTKLNQRAVTFIVCFLLATVFWFVTSMSRPYETVVTVPVSYRNLPITKQVEGDLPTALNFYFKGSGFEMSGVYLNSKPDSIIVDLTSVIGKKSSGSIETINLGSQFKGDIKPFRVSPETISPGISSRKGKRVPVKLNADIRFRDRFGYSGRIILRPDSIDIAGPESLLSKVKLVNTEMLKLNDLHKDHFGGIALKADLPDGLQLSQPYIHYFIPIEEYTEGTLDIPISIPVALRSRLSLYPATVKITYQVELSKYKSIRADDFKATAEIPYPNLPPTLEVQIKKYPTSVHKIRWEPRFVKYLIKE